MDQELELCRIALKARQADALDRAERLQAKIAADIQRLKETVQVYERAGVGAGKSMKIEYAAKAERARREGTAAAERLVMLDGIVKQCAGRTLDRLGGETPEQILMRQIGNSRYSDPVLRLMARGKLEIEHAMYAREIASILSYILSRTNAKTTYFPIATPDDPEDRRSKAERFGDARDHAEYMAMIHNTIYLPWSDRVRADLRLVIGLCYEGRSVEDLRKAYHLDWDTVLARIVEALKRYGEFRDHFHRTKVPVARVQAPGSALPLPVHSKA